MALLDGGRRDERLYAQVLNTLADTYQRLSRPADALATFQQATALMERLGDTFGLGVAYGGMGRLLYAQWRFEEAITYLRKDVDLLAEQARENASVINQLLNQTAAAYARLGQRDAALATHARAQQTLADITDPRARDTSLGFTHLQRAEILAETYQRPADLPPAREALAQARQSLSQPALKPYLDLLEARLARLAGEYAAAADLLAGCLRSDVPIADAEKALMWLEVGRVAQAQGRGAEVRAALEQVTALAAKLGNTRLAALAQAELTPLEEEAYVSSPAG